MIYVYILKYSVNLYIYIYIYIDRETENGCITVVYVLIVQNASKKLNSLPSQLKTQETENSQQQKRGNNLLFSGQESKRGRPSFVKEADSLVHFVP